MNKKPVFLKSGSIQQIIKIISPTQKISVKDFQNKFLPLSFLSLDILNKAINLYKYDP